MFQATIIWVMIALVGMMCTVLQYAVKTLCGMNDKRIYPLLRIRREDGSYACFLVSHRTVMPIEGLP